MIIHLVEIMHLDCGRPRWTTLEAYTTHNLAESRRHELTMTKTSGSLGHGHKYRVRGMFIHDHPVKDIPDVKTVEKT